MRADLDGFPIVARSARALGVRIPLDVSLEGEDVLPGKGMSVTVGAIDDLPPHRLPMSRGGEGVDPVFEHVAALPATLTATHVPPPETHWEVWPAARCPLTQYEGALAQTRRGWRRTA
jgi:hypothetical protein